METGKRQAKWFDKLTIRFGKSFDGEPLRTVEPLTTSPSKVEGKSFTILLLILLIGSVCGTAMAATV